MSESIKQPELELGCNTCSATDDFAVRVTLEERKIERLLEVGFEYVCEKDELLYFRKRK